MKYEVTNNGYRGKAFKVNGGLAVVRAGETKTVETKTKLTPAEIAAYEADGCHFKGISAEDDGAAKNATRNNGSSTEGNAPDKASTPASGHENAVTDDSKADGGKGGGKKVS